MPVCVYACVPKTNTVTLPTAACLPTIQVSCTCCRSSAEPQCWSPQNPGPWRVGGLNHPGVQGPPKMSTPVWSGSLCSHLGPDLPKAEAKARHLSPGLSSWPTFTTSLAKERAGKCPRFCPLASALSSTATWSCHTACRATVPRLGPSLPAQGRTPVGTGPIDRLGGMWPPSLSSALRNVLLCSGG